MEFVNSVADFESAMNVERCVVFLDVDWSVSSVRSRQVVGEFVEKWESESPASQVRFFRIDATLQEGRLFEAVRGWCATARVQPHPSVTGGSGPVLWVTKGAIIDHANYPPEIGVAGLWQRTEAAFGD